MAVRLTMLESGLTTGRDLRSGPPEPSDSPRVLLLSLDNLVPDDTGSIVILTGGDNLIVKLTASEDVVGRGIAATGSRSEQFDVSGMDYFEFSGGTKLYFTQDDVQLIFTRG